MGLHGGGLYEKFNRVSCWCCPLQGVKSLRVLYHDFPELWQKLKEMDKRIIENPKDGYETGAPFRVDYTVEQIEAKFKSEDYLKKISIPLFDVNTDDL